MRVGGQGSQPRRTFITAARGLSYRQLEPGMLRMVQAADKRIEQDAGEEHPYDLRTFVFDGGHVLNFTSRTSAKRCAKPPHDVISSYSNVHRAHQALGAFERGGLSIVND